MIKYFLKKNGLIYLIHIILVTAMFLNDDSSIIRLYVLGAFHLVISFLYLWTISLIEFTNEKLNIIKENDQELMKSIYSEMVYPSSSISKKMITDALATRIQIERDNVKKNKEIS